MKCYFCQKELGIAQSTEDQLNYYCHDCPKGSIKTVITSYPPCNAISHYMHSEGFGELEKEPTFAHIYVQLRSNGPTFHVRLHLKEGFTSITNSLENMEIPHIRFDPSNIVERLKIYLLFS
jgi:hypothetical protein